MQTRSRIRAIGAHSVDDPQGGAATNGLSLPPPIDQGRPSAVPVPPPTDEPRSWGPEVPMGQLSQEALLALIEDVSAWAAAKAVAEYAGQHQPRDLSQSSRRTQDSTSAPRTTERGPLEDRQNTKCHRRNHPQPSLRSRTPSSPFHGSERSPPSRRGRPTTPVADSRQRANSAPRAHGSERSPPSRRGRPTTPVADSRQRANSGPRAHESKRSPPGRRGRPTTPVADSRQRADSAPRAHESERSPPSRRGRPTTPVANSKRKADSARHAPYPEQEDASRDEPELALAVFPPRKSPFCTSILAEALPAGYKVQGLPIYDGTGDPYEHVDDFHSVMEIHNFSEAGYCKIFRSTLKKEASRWFNQLPAGSITGLEQLIQRFQANFAINKKRPKTASYLFTVTQKEGEPLQEYMNRFLQAVREVPHLSPDLFPEIIQRTLRNRKFKESLAGKPPANLEELMVRADKYIRIEEALDLGTRQKRKSREEET